MKQICIDNHILIWGIKEHANNGQENMIPRTKAFFDHCLNSKIQILVPSIVVGEFLTALDPKLHSMVINLLSSSFIIPPYDAAASSIFAQLWQENKKSGLIKEIQDELQATRQELKADCMIVATAIARKCNTLYSHDDKLKKFANGKIAVYEIPNIPYQERLDNEEYTNL